MSGYVYIKSERAGHGGAEHDLYTVGFYDPAGKWHPDSDHAEESAASDRVITLNGGTAPDRYQQALTTVRANAYPKLVAALHRAYRTCDKAAREEIGALLNDLGEAS